MLAERLPRYALVKRPEAQSGDRKEKGTDVHAPGLHIERWLIARPARGKVGWVKKQGDAWATSRREKD